jgi:hypothetical protein
MPEPIDSFADGDTSLETGVVQTATEQSMGTEIMPGGDDGAPDGNTTASFTGSNDDFSAGAAQPQQTETTDDYSGLTDLQREAQQVYGFSDDELGNMGDEQLSSMLGALDRRFTSQYSDPQNWQGEPQLTEEQMQLLQSMQDEQTGEFEQPPGGPQDIAAYQGFNPEKLEHDWGEDNMFEPEVVDAFQKVSEHYNTQMDDAARSIQQLESVVGDMLNEKQSHQQQQYDEAMDGFFDNLQGPLKEVYGSGAAAEMNPQGPEFAKRMEFANEVGMFLQHAMQTGQQPDLNQIQQRVLRSRHSTEMDANARQQVRQQAQVRRQQAMRRPNAPTGRTGTPEDNAANFLNGWYRDRNMEPTPMTGRTYGDI